MAPYIQIFARDSTDTSNTVTPTIIAGIAIAAVLGVSAIVFMGIRFYRKKATVEREEDIGSGFLTVRGVMKEGAEPLEKESTSPLPVKGAGFSRANLTNSVIMPDQSIIRPNATRDEIIQHYTAEGTLPRAFAPFAFPAAGSAGSLRPSSTASFLSIARNSFMGSARSSHRFSTASTMSSMSSLSQKRKIRQLFNPVLPDELVVSLGEQLTVVQSYDDGWCIVGKDSLFKPGEVELGAVPAWCFLKPVPGLKAERPMRINSLGVTVNIEPGTSRDEVMSWSNF